MPLRVVPGMILLSLSPLSLSARAQVPPGAPFDPLVHPNAIVTFVESEAFRASDYGEARTTAGIELLGLSGLEATREDILTAPGRSMKMRIAGRSAEVLTFPVVLQRFRLNAGGMLDLYSFRNPRTDLPADEEEAMLNSEAFTPPREPGTGRFGPLAMPESVSARGHPALLFDREEPLVLFWQEDGVSHVAVSDVDDEALFRIVEDLL